MADQSASESNIIGRDSTLTYIRNRLNTMREGHGGGMALQGESGMGKTTLLRAAVQEAEQADYRTVFVSCRGLALRPYQPIADLVYGLLDIDPSRSNDLIIAQLRQNLDHLGMLELFGQFAVLFGLSLDKVGEVENATLPDPSEIHRLLLRLIEALGRQGHFILLVFDDIDQAHVATHKVITNLAEELLPQPALLIVAFGLDVPTELARTFGRSVTRLEGLDQDAAHHYFQRLLQGSPLTPDGQVLILEHTGGNPYFVRVIIEELADRLVEDGSDQLTIPDEIHLPSLARLLLYRFQQLTAEEQETLDLATILGDGWRIGALSTLRGRPYSDTIFEDLSGLVKAGWLGRTSNERLAMYYFPVRVVQEILYDNLADDYRFQLHRKAGDYYAVPSTGRRLRIEYALQHYLLINDLDRSMELIDIALRQATQSDDQAQLMEIYRLGAEVASRDVRLIDKQSQMAQALGDMFARTGSYRQAAVAYSELAPTTAPPSLLARLGLVLLDVDTARAANVLAQVAPAIPRNTDGDLYWRVEAGLVWALARSGRIYDGIRRSRDILGKLGETAGFGSARTLMRGTLGMALFYHDDPLEAQAHLESARAGWGARGEQDGIMLINQILIRLPPDQITRMWLHFVLKPLLLEG